MGGAMIAPSWQASYSSLQWPRCSGVSRGMRTRRRRSLSTTSAARESRSSAWLWTMADSVFIEQAATIIPRSEEHTSELQSLMRISYAVFCLKKKKQQQHNQQHTNHRRI